MVNREVKSLLLVATFCTCLSTLGPTPFTSKLTGQTVPNDTSGQILHLSDFPIRDPWILADVRSKTYYLYATNNPGLSGVGGAGVMAYKSKDLKDWQRPSLVFAVPEGTWADTSQDAWAPEVHAYGGRFYLFVTLHNPAKIIAQPPDAWKITFMRGTVIASSDSPDGPFTLLKMDSPVAPSNFMSIDGTFFVDADGKPWMVYAHEWMQKIDGTIEAVRLKDDLSAARERPIALFKGSDAPWIDDELRADNEQNSYVTDGPEMYRTRDGHLLMLWSSFGASGYIETVARSKSGQLQGPWEQLPPLFEKDGGHGMLFHSFDGRLILTLHQTNRNAHAKLFEVGDAGDHLEIIRERKDLDGGLTLSSLTPVFSPVQN
jgi:beta-xylosidase